MNPDLEGRSSDRVLYILVSESNSVVPDLHMEKLDDLCFKKRFGLCNLNASCMRFSKETSFPKDCQVRSEMPSSHILGCCSGTGQRGTWHLWCNQTHWACLQRTLGSGKTSMCNELVNLWEFQIWQISTEHFFWLKKSWASSCGYDALLWPSYNSFGSCKWYKGAQTQSLGQILLPCALGRQATAFQVNAAYRLCSL